MQKESKLNTVLLVIIIILLVVGLVYIFLSNSKRKEKNLVNNFIQESQNNTNIENKTEINKSLEIYKSLKAGYEVSYPETWYKDQNIALGNELENNNTINIKNREDAVKPGGDFEMIKNGSMISVEVNSDMNYSSYEEFIKDPKWFMTEKTINERLANIETVIIDGKKIQAFTGIKTSDSLPMETYSFIYNNKLYKFNYVSGSKEQFDIDYPIFNDFLSSFHFL
jgi:hypothetical protein